MSTRAPGKVARKGNGATLAFRLRDRTLEVGTRTLIVGVLNCTPDSFYDGGHYFDGSEATRGYDEMVDEGADVIDVGGESTRPGAEPVEAQEEWRRIEPVLRHAKRSGHPVPLSVDTSKYEVAARALELGAAIINDVTALHGDPRLASLAAESGCGLVLMHMQGTPKTMQIAPRYRNLMSEIREYLASAMQTALKAGVASEQVMLDPGIGFGKTVEHNLTIIRELGILRDLGRPILIGCSRKSFIGAVADLPPEERLEGSLAAHAAAVLAGADAVRVHDVREHVRALRVIDAIKALRPLRDDGPPRGGQGGP